MTRSLPAVMLAAAVLASATPGHASASPAIRWSDDLRSHATLGLEIGRAGDLAKQPIRITGDLRFGRSEVPRHKVYVIATAPSRRCPRYPPPRVLNHPVDLVTGGFATSTYPRDRTGKRIALSSAIDKVRIRACGYLVRSLHTGALVVRARAHAVGTPEPKVDWKKIEVVIAVIVVALTAVGVFLRIVDVRTTARATPTPSRQLQRLPGLVTRGRPTTRRGGARHRRGRHRRRDPSPDRGNQRRRVTRRATCHRARGRDAPPARVGRARRYATEEEAEGAVTASQDMLAKGKHVDVVLARAYFEPNCGSWHTTTQA